MKRVLTRLFLREPLGFLLGLFFAVIVGSCTARSVCEDWFWCPPTGAHTGLYIEFTDGSYISLGGRPECLKK